MENTSSERQGTLHSAPFGDLARRQLGECANEWTEQLVLLFGFETSQALVLVRALLERYGASSELGETNVCRLLATVDPDTLAQRAGIEVEEARRGLEGLRNVAETRRSIEPRPTHRIRRLI